MRTLQDAKDTLTVREAALLIGRNASNIYRWISNGVLPYDYDENDGRTVVVKKADLVQTEASMLRHGRKRSSTTNENGDNVHD